ncbi:MAG TPA: hypothetical protein VFI31_13200 [Pirellulales bacterium]|nr:hypothetical protein [Pirellulales bacterium]
MQNSLTVLLLVTSLAFGCSKAPGPKDQVVPIDQVPKAAVEAAQKELPDIKFQTAFKKQVGDQEVYELRGKNAQGRVREAEVYADGRIYEVE